MAGCFGNSPYDRWLERQADEYWGGDDDKDEECEGDPDTAPGGHDDY
jgi:hypothetical protein